MSSHCRVRSRLCAHLHLRCLHARLPPTTSFASSAHAVIILAVVDRRRRRCCARYLLSLLRSFSVVDRQLARAAVIAAADHRRRPRHLSSPPWLLSSVVATGGAALNCSSTVQLPAPGLLVAGALRSTSTACSRLRLGSPASSASSGSSRRHRAWSPPSVAFVVVTAVFSLLRCLRW